MDDNKRDELTEKIERDLEEDERLRRKYDHEILDARVQRRKGFIQRLHLERREAALDGVVLKAQEVANLQANEIKQDEKLAVELKLIKEQEIRDEKIRQYIRENNQELRELENLLKSAYANKVLAAQIADNQARKAEEQMLEQRTREAMLKALGSQEELEQKTILLEKRKKEEYRQTLQNQIIAKERARQQEYIDFIKERKILEDTEKRIRDEEEREKAERLNMKEIIKQEMVQFHKAREVWKARERILIDKENEKLEAIVRMKEKMENEESEREERKRTCAMEEKERMIEKMSKEFLGQNKLKEELLDMLSLLREYENDEMERKKAQSNVEAETARKREMRIEFSKLLAEKEKKIKEEKELDARFAKQMNLKVQEEELRDKEKAYSKRLNRIMDRKYNEEKIKENIQKRAESLKLAQMAIEFEEEEQRRKDQMIEEERIRILKEHAPHLMGYFPKGCLKEKDLELLGIAGNSPPSKSFLPSST